MTITVESARLPPSFPHEHGQPPAIVSSSSSVQTQTSSDDQLAFTLKSSTAQEDKHHHFPTVDLVPTDPILYLPPLLSTLPNDPSFSSGPRLPSGTVDPASLALHKALHSFRPLDAQYATRPYPEAFNWAELLLDEDLEREWYCVVFRSKRNANRENDAALYSADKLAHEEAIMHGGLLVYWYGVPDPITGGNLATCIWTSQKAARKAIGGPQHIKAMRLAATSYEYYTLQRFVLRKIRGTRGLRVEDYTGGDVGW